MKLVFVVSQLTHINRKNKDWLARYQDNVVERGDTSNTRIVVSTNRVGIIKSGPIQHFIEN